MTYPTMTYPTITYLKIRKNRKPIEPQLLILGRDFTSLWSDHSTETGEYTGFWLEDEVGYPVASCYGGENDELYQARPLINIRYWGSTYTEFDIMTDINYVTYLTIIDHSGVRFWRSLTEVVNHNSISFPKFNKNIGSVFDPINRKKYPELYKEALKIVN
jgi:hypothetical protein